MKGLRAPLPDPLGSAVEYTAFLIHMNKYLFSRKYTCFLTAALLFLLWHLHALPKYLKMSRKIQEEKRNHSFL